jgi:hypothetical protein
MASCSKMSYISGDGFPFSTSSPPTITENDSFHPICRTNKLTDNTPRNISCIFYRIGVKTYLDGKKFWLQC